MDLRYLTVATALSVALICSNVTQADEPEPWVPPGDANLALGQPDHFAWTMFIALNWPADVDAKAPSVLKKSFDKLGAVSNGEVNIRDAVCGEMPD